MQSPTSNRASQLVKAPHKAPVSNQLCIAVSITADRACVAKVWGVYADTLPGRDRFAYELFDSLGTEGGGRAPLVMGSKVVVSAPHAGHVEERLSALDFLVVADLFPLGDRQACGCRAADHSTPGSRSTFCPCSPPPCPLPWPVR